MLSPLPHDYALEPGPTSARVGTGLVVVLTLAGPLAAVLSIRGVRNAPPAWVTLSIVGSLAVAMGCVALITFFAVSRTRFHVGARRFEVRTLFGSRHWPTEGLIATRCAPSFDARLLGTSMPGYRTGWFLLDGRRTLVYATSKGPGLLLHNSEKRVFITPASPDAVLASLGLAGVVVVEGNGATQTVSSIPS